ncbi:OmpA family protein [Sabulicella rubraurantiaca]|uniref:OmpA family protein n=1 Tax=Sabulicella rubraurantiaca TaxID=2811429 RepID=UPI001A95AEC2|nr:OmpA family protein [Sabulicella rubraurantiaca]
MRRRALALLLLAPLPAGAQERSRPARRRPPQAAPIAQPPPPPIEPEPEPEPPPPPPPPRPLNDPPFQLAPGVTEIPPAGWRVGFAPGAATLDPEQAGALGRIGARLAERTTGRVTLPAEAADSGDLSDTRRLSLARGRTVRAALEAGGLEGRRIDIRALGAGEDQVLILPPGVTPASPDR